MPNGAASSLVAWKHRYLARWFPPGTLGGDLLRAAQHWARQCREHGPVAATGELPRLIRAFGGGGPASEARWLAAADPTPEQLAEQRAWSARREAAVRFDLLVPLHHTRTAWLEELIESVRAQTYSHWRLHLAVAENEAPTLLSRIDHWAALDQRVQLLRLPRNDGISSTTNAALNGAEGDFVGLIDHDDRIAPNALYEFARLLAEDPGADLIYSDEDYLSANGRRRYRPVLKPDWSPHLILGYNYVGHFTVVRRSLLVELGGLRSECDGAQDWDLVLRVASRTQRIRHIPRVLYHWRAVPGSCALEPLAKPWALASQRRAVTDHLAGQQLAAQVTTGPTGMQRLVWSLDRQPLVSLVIPTRDQLPLIGRLVNDLLEATDYGPREIILVDSGSSDPRVWAQYRRWQSTNGVRVVGLPGPFNYSRACNVGAAAAEGQVLAFLNNDLEVVEPGWLAELVRWALRPGTGLVGPQLLYPQGTLQHAGIVVGGEQLGWHLFRHARPATGSRLGPIGTYRDCLALTGACQVLRREVFDQLGGFDEEFELCYSDFALALAAHRAGYRNLITPYAALVHHECATRQPLDERESRDAARFAARLRAWNLWDDPYFPQGLTAEPLPRLRRADQPSAADLARRAATRLLAQAAAPTEPLATASRAA